VVSHFLALQRPDTRKMFSRVWIIAERNIYVDRKAVIKLL
jgi:hypothetical protein